MFLLFCTTLLILWQLSMTGWIKHTWMQQNTLSQILMNLTLGQDKALQTFPKTKNYNRVSLISGFLKSNNIANKIMLIRFAKT